MKCFILLLLYLSINVFCQSRDLNPTRTQKSDSLKEVFSGHFEVGVTFGSSLIKKKHPLLKHTIKHYNSIVASNEMKFPYFQNPEGKFKFKNADLMVDFAIKNKINVHGHTLVWNSQCPDWIFKNKKGEEASRELVLKRMKTHIKTVVGRYKDKIKSWDVVNEALDANGFRKDSRWYKAIGDDYIEKAFQYAHEADPSAMLGYNDFNLENPKRRAIVITLVKNLKKKGIPIHFVGMQSHYRVDNVPKILKNIEESIIAFSKAGVRVRITELDISVLPWVWENKKNEMDADLASGGKKYQAKYDPYTKGLTDVAKLKLADAYKQLYKLYIKHSDKIDCVANWGQHDGRSWKNNFPVKGRTDYPLLFDRNIKPKAAFHAVMKVGLESKKK